ncbi:MAG: type II secretion system F family protein [Spirochaetia bacterium]|nr:type II secretion system F family protein [Spirochaetia bacterium]
MPIYRYTALTAKGKEEKGIVEAKNPAGVRSQLRSRGLYVKSIKEDEEKRERELFPFLAKYIYRVPRRAVSLFVRQLATLLDAGIPLDRSLANIIEQTENISLKKALISMRSEIVEGASLSESMKKHPDIFPPVYPNLIVVGEKTGEYEKTLLRLADLEDANIELKNKVFSALAYPVIIIFLLIGIVAYLMAFVIPMIQDLFFQFDQELPLITKIVFGVSDLMSVRNFILFSGFAAAFSYVFIKWKNSPEGRIQYEKFILSKPLIGSFMKKILLARFSRNLATLLKSRVSLLQSMNLTAALVQNRIFEIEIRDAMGKIQEGSRITEAFQESIILDQMVKGMLSAGESSDRVPEMIEKVADMMDQDVNLTVNRLSAIIEPVMMIFIASFIILIMVSILLPITQMQQNLQF